MPYIAIIIVITVINMWLSWVTKADYKFALELSASEAVLVLITWLAVRVVG